MSRGGQGKTRHSGPDRPCIAPGAVCRRPGPIRLVLGPDGQIAPDPFGKLPGRGIWVAPDRAALERAMRKNLFARAAKRPVAVPDDLIARVEAGLARRLTDLIALGRKAGQAVAGFEKVKDWLASKEVAVLLQATDGSARGKSKLWTPEGARYFSVLTARELGLAFGRASVIHGALAAGGLAPRVVEAAAKLQGLRKAADGAIAGKDEVDA